MYINPKEMTLPDYLNRQFDCSCGRTHVAQLNAVHVGPDVMEQVPILMRTYRYQKAFVVCDAVTYQIAGERLTGILEEAGLQCQRHVFAQQRFQPDENALGQLMVQFTPDVDVIVAVGTGSINDLCRFASYKWRIPYFVVATAPPMDGFASSIAAISVNHYKTTFEAQTPQAIIADTRIMKDAPLTMIAAGLGDTLGKYTCLCDWKLSRMINDEYYCENVVEMVYQCVRRAHENVGLIAGGDEQAVGSVMEALVLTGVAMSFVGNSRPASGCEHHLSHFWETRLQQEGLPPILHGHQVGLGTVLILKAAELLQREPIDFAAARQKAAAFDLEDWKRRVKAAYGEAAEGVIALEEKARKHDAGQRLARIGRIEKNWAAICALLQESLPTAEEMIDVLKSSGAPYLPRHRGLTDQMVRDALVYAMEVRERYTLLQLIADLGLSEALADRVVRYLSAVAQREKE